MTRALAFRMTANCLALWQAARRLVLLVPLTCLAASSAAFGQRVVADFNGDGIDDLAIGAPAAENGRGKVSVYFGTDHGFPTTASVNRSGSSDGEAYGSALAAGNFNGSGRFELAVGAPGFTQQAGRVEIVQFVDSSSGRIVTTGVSFTQGLAHGGLSEIYSRFGAALATGDFDADGYTDLAVGIPGAHSSGTLRAGAVNVLYGTVRGLTPARTQLWHQRIVGVAGDPNEDDAFGAALAVGDFNGDRRDDLAIGVPYDDAVYTDQGVVNILYGRRGGLSTDGQQMLRSLDGSRARGGNYGAAVAAADFDGDGFDDLAIGGPSANARSGAVVVRYGTAVGLRTELRVLQGQDDAGVAEFFGLSLTADDFDRDGYADLAVGAPNKTVEGIAGAGAVSVFYGMAIGAFGVEHLFHQNRSKVQEDCEPYDFFGYSLTFGDFNGDGFGDLAVGIPFEDILSNTVADVGAVALFPGAPGGIRLIGNQLIIAPSRTTGALFGRALQR